ncbi:MAG: DUF4397 domain-containing protein [Alphaproteobacteria bacterium]|nr:DUF4397 domain-containing protein [Alphaproteobacteria bacterium]
MLPLAACSLLVPDITPCTEDAGCERLWGPGWTCSASGDCAPPVLTDDSAEVDDTDVSDDTDPGDDTGGDRGWLRVLHIAEDVATVTVHLRGPADADHTLGRDELTPYVRTTPGTFDVDIRSSSNALLTSGRINVSTDDFTTLVFGGHDVYNTLQVFQVDESFDAVDSDTARFQVVNGAAPHDRISVSMDGYLVTERLPFGDTSGPEERPGGNHMLGLLLGGAGPSSVYRIDLPAAENVTVYFLPDPFPNGDRSVMVADRDGRQIYGED